MMINKLYFWSRKIHKLTMWLAILLIIPLVLSGLILEDLGEAGGFFLVIDPNLVRAIHRLFAQPTALMLGVMIGSGLVMWGVPFLKTKKIIK